MSDFLSIVQAFQLAIKATLMYTTSHPRTRAALDTLEGHLSDWFTDKTSLHLAAYEGKLFLDGAPFEGTHVHLGALAKQLLDRQISGLIFQRGVTGDELESVVELLILKPAKIEEAGGAAAILEKKALPHVRLSQTQYKEVREGEGGDDDLAGPGSGKSPQDSPAASEAVVAAAMAAIEAMSRRTGEFQARGPGRGMTPGEGSGISLGLGKGPGQGAGQGIGLGPGMGPGYGFAPGGGQGEGDGSGISTGSGEGMGPGLGERQPGSGGTGAGQGSAAGAGYAEAAFDLQILTDQWEDQLDQVPQPSLLEEGGFEPANLGFLGGTPLAFGMGDNFPPAQQVQGLRNALMDMDPASLLSVVAGVDSLPYNPAGMRMAFQGLTAEAFGHASAELMAGDVPWEASKEAIFSTLRYAPQQQSMLAALEMELRNRGLGLDSQARFRELLDQLNWENLPLEEQIELALNHGQFWSLTLDQRLAFLRRLLNEGRFEPFLAVLDEILARLAGENPSHREQAAATLKGVTRWLVDPGLPLEAEGPIRESLVATFGWEPHLHIHMLVTDALDHLLEAILTKGDPGQALVLLEELTGLCQFQETSTPWREAALQGLHKRLSDPAALRKVVEQLHNATSEQMLKEIIPFLEAGGEAACRILVQVLGEEPDRKRRGRLIEAIRGLGAPALPALYEGLDSPAWYLVRNTLNLLGDLGDAGALSEVERCLGHPDQRVKRAAVRTLWKVCGPAAVPNLLGLIPSADPETQAEIIFALGQLRSKQAVPTLSAYALDRRRSENLRTRAAETLGQIGDPEAVPALRELASRKGRIFTSAEPPQIRVAAFRSLLSLATAEAQAAAIGILTAEPRNKDRALLQQILDEHRAL